MIELKVFPLKYEVNYNNKSYIIEAVDYFNNTDETKWLVLFDNEVLTKNFEFGKRHLIENNNNYVFNTRDEAINALTIYISIEDRLEKERAKYNLDISKYKEALHIKDISNIEIYNNKNQYFMPLDALEYTLRRKKVDFINLSCSNSSGLQVRVRTIKQMLGLEQAIKDIENEFNDYTVVNYFNDTCSVISLTWPLYYYWQAGR